jgi:hypothetical protein
VRENRTHGSTGGRWKRTRPAHGADKVRGKFERDETPLLPAGTAPRQRPTQPPPKYKNGQRYLTVVCDHVTGRVVWTAKGRSKDTVRTFFAALGERAAALQSVSCDGAEWIHSVVTNVPRLPWATVS